ncbi:zinc-binding dehydrogenase [Stenotrophomonas indicatrix]|uniref:zinc-binding dehydrogenase n=1 Tax=Stenotrophomonas indicatrix TaxID=2045451 RepID=UPI000FD811E7|nr:zinc-binding dehydrogenase [Stenotrophomonas indicatrix]
MTTTIRFHQYGGPEVLTPEDEQVGRPLEGQVRLRHEAIGVNFIDTAFRRGIFPMPLPGVTGVEGAGIVEETGPGVDFQVGDRVAYFLSPGSYAEVRLIKAGDLIATPEDITSVEIATILTKGLTAWAALNGFHTLRAGETVLVQGASSNVGLLVARWARARGARVIGTTSSSEKLAAIRDSVDYALLSSDASMLERLKAIAPAGVDVVYEFVGKATFDTSVAAVRNGGTIATIGAASGQPDADPDALSRRNVRVVGGPMAQHLQGRTREAINAVFAAHREGTFGDYKANVYPLRDAAAAHADVSARRKLGPMVLVP